jgi:hypothetical protein
VIILGIILVVLGYALGVSDLEIIGVLFLLIGAIVCGLRAISRVLVSQLGTERHEDRMPAGRRGRRTSVSRLPGLTAELEASSQHARWHPVNTLPPL